MEMYGTDSNVLESMVILKLNRTRDWWDEDVIGEWLAVLDKVH